MGTKEEAPYQAHTILPSMERGREPPEKINTRTTGSIQRHKGMEYLLPHTASTSSAGAREGERRREEKGGKRERVRLATTRPSQATQEAKLLLIYG